MIPHSTVSLFNPTELDIKRVKTANFMWGIFAPMKEGEKNWCFFYYQCTAAVLNNVRKIVHPPQNIFPLNSKKMAAGNVEI